MPMPIANVNTSNRAGVIRPMKVNAARREPVTIMWTATSSNSQRRSKESASTPAGSASSIIGVIVAAWTSATTEAALGRSISSHWAPTVCIQPPIVAISMANQSHPKARRWKGAQSEWSAAALSPSLTMPLS